ncbi:MAG TPA: hypothetical protein VNG71_04620, partial [Pyrinomonadaceae bacterium]|nr:hypothetical protein [Pyrinomonadaceae bacterium]
MFCSIALIRQYKSFCLVIALAFCFATPRTSQAQAYEKELSASGKASFTIKNRTGRVSVIASDNEKDASSLKATSTGGSVEPSDITVSGNEIVVRDRPYRIDLIVRVPKRSRVRVESETGMVDVVGDLEIADVITNTGTIHADVPTDALKLKFEWASSRPRYLSDVELPKVKEGRGGAFSISGTIGPDAKRKKDKKKDKPPSSDSDKDENDGTNPPADPTAASGKPDEPKEPERQQLVRLNFVTQRGVILLNVDPSMAPNDLRERPLTDAAKAIVRSGNEPLIDAVRKVSPRMFGDYARTLPAPRNEPTLVSVAKPGEMVTAVSPQLMRVNASVTDRNGRA